MTKKKLRKGYPVRLSAKVVCVTKRGYIVRVKGYSTKLFFTWQGLSAGQEYLKP